MTRRVPTGRSRTTREHTRVRLLLGPSGALAHNERLLSQPVHHDRAFGVGVRDPIGHDGQRTRDLVTGLEGLLTQMDRLAEAHTGTPRLSFVRS